MVLENAVNGIEDDEEDFVDELKTGTKLLHKQYVIEDFLNSGGFGITYLARDSLNRQVVIKECFPSSFCHRKNMSIQPRSRAHQAQLRGIVRLFAREAISLAKVEHPNIVGVHNVFEDNNTAYMAMDYIKGRDLLEIIEDDSAELTPKQITEYLEKLLSAIGYVHESGLLHRDISPDNILINEEGEPILIDFGAARDQAGEVNKALSALRVVKDGYSPQEFYIAGSEQGPSCDLYSLAASFYHIITGELPPDSQARLAAMAASEADPYVPLAERTKEFTPAFAAALDKAIAILPKDRVQSADEWLQMMRQKTVEKKAKAAAKPAKKADSAKGGSSFAMLAGTTALAVAGVSAYFVFSGGEEASIESVTSEVATPLATAPVETPAPEAVEEVVAAPAPEATEVVVAAPVETPEPVEVDIVNTLPSEPLANETTAEVAIAEPVEALPFEPVVSLPVEEAAVTGPRTFGPAIDPNVVADEIAFATVVPAEPIAVVEAVVELAPPQQVVDVAEEMAQVDIATDLGVSLPAQDATVEPIFDASAIELPKIPVSAPVPETAAEPAEERLESGAIAQELATTEVGASAPVVYGRTIELPFNVDPNQPGLIGRLHDDAPAGLEQGQQVVSINGFGLADLTKIGSLVNPNEDFAETGHVALTLGVTGDNGTTVTDITVSAPVSYDTVLMSGLSFRSEFVEDTWVTRVTQVPETFPNLMVGDVLLANMQDNVRFDGPTDLRSTIEAGIENETSLFGIAVLHEGTIRVETLNLLNL